MTDVDQAVRACLINLDIAAMRRLWADVHAHKPQPESDDELLLTMHLARMQMKTLPPRLLAHSKRWLEERGGCDALA